MRNKRFPSYPDDADYTTNAPSYYEDLARKQKLIELLAKKIWDYDERLNQKIGDLEEVLSSYLSQWDERIENLDDEVSHIFVTWLNDGTLEQIINHDVLGNKADKSYVDDFNDNVTTQLQKIVEYSEDFFINAKEFGLVGDGVTDDTTKMQEAFDYLYNKGGGRLYFPNGHYKVTKPIIVKSVALEGNYTSPRILIEGESNSGSRVFKVGSEVAYGYDSVMIGIRGSTMEIDDSLSAIHFNNITLENESIATTTYAFYMRRGSRIIVDYSHFAVKQDYATIHNHDRYAFRVESIWSSSFRDSTFRGDYGLYITGNSTSLLLENLFVNTHKIGYRLAGNYSTINNCFGDYCRGDLFYFYYARYSATNLGGESPECDRMMVVQNAVVTVDSAFFYQSDNDEGVVVEVRGVNSTAAINALRVMNMGSTSKGYLWKANNSGALEIKNLQMDTGASFKYIDSDGMNTHNTHVIVTRDVSNTAGAEGIHKLHHFPGGYWDWYMETPIIPANTIVFGFSEPWKNSTDRDMGYQRLLNKNDVVFNSNFENRNVLGWVRHNETGDLVRNGDYWYIPLIRSGDTASRPLWTTVGMEYFDTTLGKPIWCKSSGTTPVWVDATGTTV